MAGKTQLGGLSPKGPLSVQNGGVLDPSFSVPRAQEHWGTGQGGSIKGRISPGIEGRKEGRAFAQTPPFFFHHKICQNCEHNLEKYEHNTKHTQKRYQKCQFQARKKCLARPGGVLLYIRYIGMCRPIG